MVLPVERLLEPCLLRTLAHCYPSATHSAFSPALARLSAESYDPGEIDVTYDAELGGEPAYQLLRRLPDLPATYEYGAGHRGRATIVGIAFHGGSARAEEEQLVDEVLAGFVWN
ncbi:hypothetical protein GCM10009623_10280 [Nocardioides aestuarii]|uniref:Uncharacterized protein n=1 Tax=Nocardioides aestuarii TaxID=252231 RepID=A0ABW4TM63_9ACTN